MEYEILKSSEGSVGRATFDRHADAPTRIPRKYFAIEWELANNN